MNYIQKNDSLKIKYIKKLYYFDPNWTWKKNEACKFKAK